MWQETYGGTSVEYATCITNTFDGGFAVTGYTYSYGYGNSDICLLKLHHNGSLQWVKTIGGINEDISYCLVQSADSGYVLVGSTTSYGQNIYEDMFIVKLNSNGELLWARTIGANGSDIAYTLKQTDDGGYIVVGYSVTYHPLEYGLMIVKINDYGTIEWTKMAGKVGNNFLSPSVIQTPDGGYGIASTIDSVIGGSDMCFMKLSNLGMLEWSCAIGGTDYDEAFSVCQTSGNGYALTGVTNSFGAEYPNLYIVKISNVGLLEWTRTFGGDNDDIAVSVMNTSDGGLTIAGECFSFGAGSIDMYIVKLDSKGRFIWNKTIGGSDMDFMRSMVRDNDGGYVAVGRTYSFGAGASDMYIVKMDLLGNTCGYTGTPVPHIDSGGTLLQIPVNIYNITPRVISPGPNISGWGGISNLCFTGLHPNSSLLPDSFSLHQNYPNPFNPVTKIKFDLPKHSNAKIIIYDFLGREVATLVNEQLKPGSYEVEWDGSGYASGSIFLRADY